MAFFDLPSPDELTTEARQVLDEYQRLQGRSAWTGVWHTYGRLPAVLSARLALFKSAYLELLDVPTETKCIAAMLIAHARRCQACFAGARTELKRLGFDEPTLDGFCANPDALPLKERDRHFIRYTLRIAMSSADLTPKDYREMEAHGFSRIQIQEMIAFSAYWVLNTMFSQSATAGLADE
jgi:hypothetical protein